MSRTLVLSAPGKLVLLGEYAVLDGRPALVAAVDRRARVELRSGGGPGFSVHAPGITRRPERCELTAAGLLRRDRSATRLPLAASIVSGLIDCGTIAADRLEPFAATLDTRAFSIGRGRRRAKLGIGSSAALTVAFASALARWAGVEEPAADGRRWLQTLVDLHRRFQGGAGSGIDIAAALLGGIIRYRLDSDGRVAVADYCRWPPELSTVIAWTGRSSSTGHALDRLRQRRLEVRRPIDAALDRLGDLAEAGMAAIDERRVADFLALVDASCDVLEELGRAAAIDILSDEHRRLRRLAAGCGVRYKPSGAGGGDVGVAFAADPAAAAAFAAAARRAGFATPALALDARGLE